MVTGTAADNDKASAPFYFRHKIFYSAQNNTIFVEQNSTAHGVYNAVGLFEYFLLHKTFVIAFHNLLNFHVQHVHFSSLRSVAATGRRRCVRFQTFNSMNSQSCEMRKEETKFTLTKTSFTFKIADAKSS